ncbi:putative diguanylate cyclase YcdT [Symmachiella dynata]|uniref:diguanylate cyclase n=1 Tax=Symmachiella dynata TaxID=2527995 RepID=A0A517ZLZ7_9PLAN|nr:GGDEF domain-containing protein [Symmachiella dynata]QDU43494.1 putative diguanylate cyclase YcdT [Symmachiella dynata]
MPSTIEILNRLKSWPLWMAVFAALALAAVVGWVDYTVGDAFDLSLLYVPIIAIVCWVVNLRAAVMFAVLCSLIWLMDDWIVSGIALHGAEVYWESAVRFLLFVAFAVVLTHLQTALQRESALARNDPLTGLANLTSFVEEAERASHHSRRGQTPITVIFLDCDHFKEVNDQFGHPQGDALLKDVADCIRSSIRRGDVAARMGGDEFAILCPGMDESLARQIAERVKGDLDRKMQSGNWPVTFSIGVATFPIAPPSVADLIRESDNLMYAVKHDTRDGVRFKTVSNVSDVA